MLRFRIRQNNYSTRSACRFLQSNFDTFDDNNMQGTQAPQHL